MLLPKFKKGFTLIEILLVVAILSILLVVVFAALNPATRLQDTRDARRWNDINQLLTATHEFIVDNDGSMPAGLSNGLAETEIGTCDGSATNPTCTGITGACVDLGTALGPYLSSAPNDPSGASADATGYTVQVDTNGIITFTACHAEGGSTISVSR